MSEQPSRYTPDMVRMGSYHGTGKSATGSIAQDRYVHNSCMVGRYTPHHATLYIKVARGGVKVS